MDRSKKFVTEKGDMHKVTREESLENMKRQKERLEDYAKQHGLDEIAKECFGHD